MKQLRFEPSPALAEILSRDAANGVDPFDDAGAPRPTPGAPNHVEPIPRLAFERPNWRQEEARAIRQNKAAEQARQAAGEPDPGPPDAQSLDPVPAKARPRAEKRVPTPNIDRVMADRRRQQAADAYAWRPGP